jgi:hypothetical protein
MTAIFQLWWLLGNLGDFSARKMTKGTFIGTCMRAMAAWSSGTVYANIGARGSWDRIPRRSRVRIPPGCKVFMNLYLPTLQRWCRNLICMHCHCVYLRKINAQKNTNPGTVYMANFRQKRTFFLKKLTLWYKICINFENSDAISFARRCQSSWLNRVIDQERNNRKKWRAAE